MAQEVQKVMPEAVVRGRDGYLRVYYDRLGVTFESYDRWVSSGARVPTSSAVDVGRRAALTRAPMFGIRTTERRLRY